MQYIQLRNAVSFISVRSHLQPLDSQSIDDDNPCECLELCVSLCQPDFKDMVRLGHFTEKNNQIHFLREKSL